MPLRDAIPVLFWVLLAQLSWSIKHTFMGALSSRSYHFHLSLIVLSSVGFDSYLTLITPLSLWKICVSICVHQLHFQCWDQGTTVGLMYFSLHAWGLVWITHMQKHGAHPGLCGVWICECLKWWLKLWGCGRRLQGWMWMEGGGQSTRGGESRDTKQLLGSTGLLCVIYCSTGYSLTVASAKWVSILSTFFTCAPPSLTPYLEIITMDRLSNVRSDLFHSLSCLSLPISITLSRPF